MTAPPVVRRIPQTTFREVEKQTRAFDRGRVVRVFGDAGTFIQRLDPLRDVGAIRRLLAAPNAVPVRKHGGELVWIAHVARRNARGRLPATGV